MDENLIPHRQVQEWHGFTSAIFHSGRGTPKELLCSVSSTYILIQSPTLNFKSHLSSNPHCKWNTRYKEMHRVPFHFYFCHIKILSGKSQSRKLLSYCSQFSCKDHSFRKQPFLWEKERWYNIFFLRCFIQTERFLMKRLICGYHVRPISLQVCTAQMRCLNKSGMETR